MVYQNIPVRSGTMMYILDHIWGTYSVTYLLATDLAAAHPMVRHTGTTTAAVIQAATTREIIVIHAKRAVQNPPVDEA